MKKTFSIGDKVLVHGKWEGVIKAAARHNQWVVDYEKKGKPLTNTLPATQIEYIPQVVMQQAA